MRSTLRAAAFVLAMSSGWDAFAGPRGVEARYIVFTLDASGVARPQFHAVVTLAAARPSRSEAELSAWLHAGAADEERVGVRLEDASGRVVFRDTVSVPRWQRTELGLHGEGEPERFQIPPTAWAVSVNLTVTRPTQPGHLRVFPGEVSVSCGQGSGTAHFILDVNGYFE